MDSKVKKRLRSQDWFGKQDKDGFIHRSWLKNQGYPDDLFDGRPVIGICNTWSELTPCNGHFRELAEFVKRGVYEAGGFPLEFPGDVAGRDAAQADRDVVSQSRQHGRRRIHSRQSDGRRGAAHGLRQDHALAAHGCGQLRSADHRHFGRADAHGPFPRKQIGSGTGVWQMSEDVRGGRMSAGRIHGRRILHASLEGPLHDHGHRIDHGQHGRGARRLTTRQRGNPRGRCAPLSSRATFGPAHRGDGARGSGAVEDPHAQGVRERHQGQRGHRRIHELGGAPAGHRGPTRRQARARGLGQARLAAAMPGEPAAVGQVPDGRLLLRGRPARGAARDRAGAQQGRAHRQRQDHGREHRELHRAGIAMSSRSSTIRSRPRRASPSCAAISRPTARSSSLPPRRPNYSSIAARPWCSRPSKTSRQESMHPNLDIDENCIMVLKGCGPKGYPGMAEVGNMPLPPKILRKGITDMVRISDARMSGTAYGTVVLHVAPEAAAGGPLALVSTGDIIELDVPARKLHLDVSDAELARRKAEWMAPEAAEARLLQVIRRTRAASRQGRRPRLPGRRQRYHGYPRLALTRRAAGETFRQWTCRWVDVGRILAPGGLLDSTQSSLDCSPAVPGAVLRPARYGAARSAHT